MCLIILFTWFPSLLLGISNDLSPPQKLQKLCTEYGTPTCNAWDSYMFLFMRYNVYNVFIVWPLVIWNGLWLPPKMIQIWYRSSVHFTSWDVLYISFSQFWLWWQLITSVLHQEPLESCTQCGVPSCQSLFFSTIWCPVHVLIQFLCNFL